MDAEAFIGSLVRGVLMGSGRRKRGRRAARFLTGGGSSFLNASTLLSVAGLAWGLLESTQPRTTVPGPPVPGTAGTGAAASPPPLPTTVPPPVPVAAPTAVSPEIHKLVQLTISAARADGELSQAEMDEILALARQVGAESIVQQELQKPALLADIVSGMTDPRAKEDLYTFAFAVVHADEGISGAERIYLAELALELGLDETTTSRLESDTQTRIAGA